MSLNVGDISSSCHLLFVSTQILTILVAKVSQCTRHGKIAAHTAHLHIATGFLEKGEGKEEGEKCWRH